MEKVAMIIEKQSDVTAAVLEQLQQSSDPRFKEIMIAAVTHLHGFIRDARLSEAEFHQACALIARLGQLTTANLMGPFWRMDSPPTENGGSIVRSPTPGMPVFVNAWVRDRQGRPVPDAEVDVWHASSEGFYENQDPEQADMNLRGKFRTDAA